ncbi:carotenoid biosynthesis protein [Thermococcus argininiproducens]|uniref:Carotenoid biosynthesis protein n=1 Tax=Thermococcus argininiproducens TaxID=2866384 RepID=A0A9E7MA93_9EURY|nr:carotenoid biosynthesis protein [Thermococcus argininiproducens]USG99527.1 carotenoid biosynthesis protein [Thermococcus argininiproducens]
MKRDLHVISALILLANIFKRSPIYNLFYLLAMVVASQRLWRDFPRFFAISVLVGFLAEVAGTHMCTPFGCYYYENLKPQLFGVAVFVPLAWAIFGFVSYLTARYFFNSKTGRILFASLLMVILDLSIDPIMTSWRAWVWKTTTAVNWFGIPWTNYLGWFIVSLTFFYLYERISKGEVGEGLLKLAPSIYLLEMFTFMIYAPRSVKAPTEIAFLISLAVILPLYLQR